MKQQQEKRLLTKQEKNKHVKKLLWNKNKNVQNKDVVKNSNVNKRLNKEMQQMHQLLYLNKL